MLEIQKTIDDANAFFDCTNKCYTVILRKLNNIANRFCKFEQFYVDGDGALEIEISENDPEISENDPETVKPKHYVAELRPTGQYLDLWDQDKLYAYLSLNTKDGTLYEMMEFMRDNAKFQNACTILPEKK